MLHVMLIFFRALVMIAMALVAIVPAHAHSAVVEVHHAAPGHAHGSHGDEAPSGDGADLCCASISLQCGSPIIGVDSGWTPVGYFPVQISRLREGHSSGSASFLEFEPPPPRV